MKWLKVIGRCKIRAFLSFFCRWNARSCLFFLQFFFFFFFFFSPWDLSNHVTHNYRYPHFIRFCWLVWGLMNNWEDMPDTGHASSEGLRLKLHQSRVVHKALELILASVAWSNEEYYYTSGLQWNSDWSRAYSQYTIACEVDMITQCLKQTLGYHVQFKVCLVSKPLVRAVFSNFCKLWEKCLPL